MRRRWIATILTLGVGMIALTIMQCQMGDRIPPKGSTIIVAGNPTTIPVGDDTACKGVLKTTANCGTSQIVATVYSDLGVPLPDQDVRFSSASGLLYTGDLSSPTLIANIPVQTDSSGNARVSLVTSTTSTVTARSGLASGTLTLSTVQGNISVILLNTCAGSDTNIVNCSTPVCLEATAQDSSGNGIPGVVIEFTLKDNVSTSGSDTYTFSGTFTKNTVTTDATGVANTSFTPTQDSCSQAQCGGLGHTCQGTIVATVQGGAFPSTLSLQINIPQTGP